ncbi:LLM class flavin-dependent oxidoreductase [Pseudonocardia sp. RS010]|uniref:LLM class flavin-dependent oxidoreductase n=1 Tax=Pseudonocardia sp. RS010 TaxID=3385979 RepID=UPI0039A343C8
MEIDCALAATVATPEHVALAEQLGYARAWCHDAPRSYSDAGMALAVAAERTSRIRIGLAVGGHWRRASADAGAVADLAVRARGRTELVVGLPGGSGRDPEAHAAAVREVLRREHGVGGVPAWLARPGATEYVPLTFGVRSPRGAALRTVVEVTPGADLDRVVARLRPAGLLLRPTGADVGRELTEFAAAVRALELAGVP